MSASVIGREFVACLIEERELAHRALKWLLAHRVYWDRRTERLLEPWVGGVGRVPTCLPPDDILVLVLTLAREIELDAEQAG